MGFFSHRLTTPGAVLAPMAGFSDAPFRLLCREAGSLWAITEMVSAKALVLGGQRGIEIGEPYPGEPDLVIQIFAADPDLASEAAALLYRRYRPVAFDLNMGCPVKKIVNKGCGSELMRHPERAAAVVAAIATATPAPVSAKMRLGVDERNVMECALAVVEAGAEAVAVHGRTAVQKYDGHADWEAIAAVAADLEVPVIGSGDVDSAEQVRRYRRMGLGVMIGRGALGRPWIFDEIRGGHAPAPEARARTVYRHAALACSWYGEAPAMRMIRGQLARYARTVPGLADARPALVRVDTLATLGSILNAALATEVVHPVPPLERSRWDRERAHRRGPGVAC